MRHGGLLGALLAGATQAALAQVAPSTPPRAPAAWVMFIGGSAEGPCSLRAWSPATRRVSVLAPLAGCPVALFDDLPPTSRAAGRTLLAVSRTHVERLVLDGLARVTTHVAVRLPDEWAGLVGTRQLAVGRFRDSGRLGAATTTGDDTRDCRFEYHEHVDGGWIRQARPSATCVTGYGGTRAYDSAGDGQFEAAFPAVSDADVTLDDEPARHGNAPLSMWGYARRTETGFVAGPRLSDDEWWSFVTVQAGDRPTTVYYLVALGDHVWVQDLYVQPQDVRPRRVPVAGAAYPSVAGTTLVGGASVIDLATGADAIDEPTRLPFWFQPRR